MIIAPIAILLIGHTNIIELTSALIVDALILSVLGEIFISSIVELIFELLIIIIPIALSALGVFATYIAWAIIIALELLVLAIYLSIKTRKR